MQRNLKCDGAFLKPIAPPQFCRYQEQIMLRTDILNMNRLAYTAALDEPAVFLPLSMSLKCSSSAGNRSAVTCEPTGND